jgi:hypothetical protein
MSETRDAAENKQEEEAVEFYLQRLNGHAWGMALGVLFGLALLVATLILVVRGGEDVGQHLGLLSSYFWGYDVTYVGSLVGFVYAFVVGYLTGRVICGVYNRASR